MGKAGQPTLYKEEYNSQVEKLCLLGHTDKEIADFFDVCESTINNWKHEHPIFLESIKKGKDIFDTDMVEKSLRIRATGMILTEEKQTTRKLKMGDDSEESDGEIIDTTITKKEIAPDTTAMIFWLKNRQSDRWRDKQEVEQTGEMNLVIKPPKFD